MKPRLLDLFCGAGGAAVGYHRAGFDVIGVDIKPQPNYPFEFVQADALDWLEEWVLSGHDIFDAIHASPPCQAHVKGMRAMNGVIGRTDTHMDYIAPTRELLIDWAERFGYQHNITCDLDEDCRCQLSRGPYVIENVEGAPLQNPVRLCGSSFGLAVRRHRLFECTFGFLVPPCAHHLQREQKYWNSDRSVRLPDGTRKYTGHGRLSSVVQVYGAGGDVAIWGPAMGIDWMDPSELREAIPPAYTEFIGQQLLAHIRVQA